MGPTASGKSAVALAVARSLGDVEIVTADSMQVYRGMDIGTAKPSPQERAMVAHHLIDVAEPTDPWSVSEWLRAARSVLGAIEGRGNRALLVGGSGLYFHALVDGLEPPAQYPEVRADLEEEVERGGAAALAQLHGRLAELDPLAASRMEPANRRRVIRALEVTLGSGKPFSSAGAGLGVHPATAWRIWGLWLPRPVAGQRIARRLAAMLDAGLVAEVEALVAGGGMGRTARQALGYREILSHLEGRVSLPSALDEAVRRTRAFARRQRMWWRRDPRVAWVGTTDNPLAVAPLILRDWAKP